MVESVDLPCILDTFLVLTPGVPKLVRILGCTANLAYLKGTRRVPLRYPQNLQYTQEFSLVWTLQELSRQKAPKREGSVRIRPYVLPEHTTSIASSALGLAPGWCAGLPLFRLVSVRSRVRAKQCFFVLFFVLFFWFWWSWWWFWWLSCW